VVGQQVLPEGNPDLYVLTLPLGGGALDSPCSRFSAGSPPATSMLIVGAIAARPWCRTYRHADRASLHAHAAGVSGDVAQSPLTARRISIGAVLLLGLFYFRSREGGRFASIGLIASTGDSISSVIETCRAPRGSGQSLRGRTPPQTEPAEGRRFHLRNSWRREIGRPEAPPCSAAKRSNTSGRSCRGLALSQDKKILEPRPTPLCRSAAGPPDPGRCRRLRALISFKPRSAGENETVNEGQQIGPHGSRRTALDHGSSPSSPSNALGAQQSDPERPGQGTLGQATRTVEARQKQRYRAQMSSHRRQACQARHPGRPHARRSRRAGSQNLRYAGESDQTDPRRAPPLPQT
jgi:hypothetical protein